MKKRIFYAISVLALLLGVSIMGISDVGKVCLFSAMSGVITLDGKPVANARLVRKAEHGAKSDEATTDKEGNFKFPAMYKRTVAKYLPQEFVVHQEIVVSYNNKEYQLWEGVKGAPEENVESKGKPLVVKCELNREVNHLSFGGSVFFTLCTWDVESDPPMEWNKDNLFEPGT
jgi:hypothetical protein